MKKVTITAKTVQDAVNRALKELDAAEDQVIVTVLEEPTKGFLGLIRSKDAKVEVELKPDPVQEAKKFLQDVLESMGITGQIEVFRKEDHILFHIIGGSQLGFIIGKRGQTLDSLQYLVNLIANRYSSQYVRIAIDAENYREKRKQTLEQLADRLANKVVKTGKLEKLEPMTPLERKIIHARLQDRKDIYTYSEGNEPHRRIVITLKK